MLDARLNLKEHVKQRTSKAYSSSWVCHRTLGKTWGLKPKIVKWLYTDVVQPMLMHVVVVYWQRSGHSLGSLQTSM
jgi:hypothetical protein